MKPITMVMFRKLLCLKLMSEPSTETENLSQTGKVLKSLSLTKLSMMLILIS